MADSGLYSLFCKPSFSPLINKLEFISYFAVLLCTVVESFLTHNIRSFTAKCKLLSKKTLVFHSHSLYYTPKKDMFPHV